MFWVEKRRESVKSVLIFCTASWTVGEETHGRSSSAQVLDCDKGMD
jgi:hypothetical protein